MQKNQGITLVSLVITIIVLLILASVATYSGLNVVNSSKLTAFTAELKIMQTQVNAIYEENSEKQIGEEITGDIQTQANKVFTESESGITSREGYRYWNQELIKELGIEGVGQDFFVNVEKRSIVSYQGLKYEGKTYYTLNQVPNGLYNVGYENPNQGKPTFQISQEKLSDGKWKITVSDIQYTEGYINKWQVRYQIEGKENWNTTKDLSFVVDQMGTYKIQLVNGEITSEEKELVIESEYVKDALILHYDAINNTGEGDDKHSMTTTVWKDLSGNENNGTLSGFNNTEDSGWKSKGLKFDGQDDIVKTSEKFDFSSLQAGVPFSYGATITVKDVSAQWYGIMTNMTTWGQGGFNIQYGSAQKIAIGMGEYINSTTQPAANVTYNIYGVYDGSLMKLYVNGKLENSMTYDIKSGNNIITIGCFYDVHPVLLTNGEILNVKVYNKALTEKEIRNNFEIDKLRFEL